MKKFIFNTVRIVMEDDKIDKYLDKKKYQKIVIITYNKLDIGKDFHVHHKLTPNIYLDKDLEDILLGFGASTRNQVRRTFREPDLKFVSNDKNFNEIYNIYKSFEYAQGRVPFSKKAMKDYLVFSAYYKGELISLILCFDSFPFLRSRSICSKRLETEYRDRKKYRIISIATRRLVYEVCKHGKERGYKLFDLGSMPSNLKDKKKAGIAEFKSSFGDRLEDEYTYTYKSKIYRTFEKLVGIKLFLFKILKK